MANILIVDDDPHIRELVHVLLQQEGFTVYEAANGEEALEKVAYTDIEMVILDIMMPKMDGWELSRELRAYYDFPLLMLTAKRETMDKVKGFELGTDDYLVKPFEPLELVARVKALLKRYQIATSRTIELGRLQLNGATYEVLEDGKSSIVPKKEFDLLFLLASYPNKTFTREHLIEKIWGFDYEGDERTVDVHVKRLRNRFAFHQEAFQIKTVHGLGYRLERLL